MGKSDEEEEHCHSHRHTNLSSFFAAFIFLLLLAAAVTLLYLLVLKPRNPILTVDAVNLPSFSAANSTFTFTEYVALRNPNHGVFSHYDGSLRLLSGENQLGFVFVPAGEIAAERTKFLAATFAVKSLYLSESAGRVFELETRLEISGHLRILNYFVHHVDVRAHCRVAVSAADGSVLGIHC